MRRIGILGAAAMVGLFGAASTASASLILVGPNPVSGTGLGNVNTVLTVTSPGSSTSETGCVRWTGSATSTSGCGFADSNVQAQFGTPTLASVGVTSATDLRIIFNADEPGAASDILLNSLALTLYNATGTASATFSTVAPLNFPNTFPGTGNSGFLFRLDALQAATAQSFILANGGFGSVHLGLGSSLSNATGGKETFFVTNVAGSGGGDITVPEPSAMMLLGTALLGFAGVARRRIRR